MEQRLTWNERGELWLRLGIRLVLALGGLFVLLQFGRGLLRLFGPFLGALAAAAVLEPLIRRLTARTGWKRGAVTLVLLLALLGVVGSALAWLVYGLAQEVITLAENWDSLLSALVAMVERVDRALWQLAELLPVAIPLPEEGILDWLVAQLPDALPELDNLASFAGEKAMKVSYFVVALVFFLMATYFLAADWSRLRTLAVDHMSGGMRRFCSQVRTTALAAFGGYLKAQVLLSVGVFFVLAAGFFLVRQPYALLLALGLAVMDFIPIIGSGTVMVPWAIISLVSGQLPQAVRTLVIWGVIVVFRRVMEPKFVGDQTGLSPLLSLMSIYVGMRLWGVAGMILTPILVLVFLNLARAGVFDGARRDLCRAANDVCAILRGA